MQHLGIWFRQRKVYVSSLGLFFLACLTIGFDKNVTDTFHTSLRPLDYWICLFTFLGDGRVLIPGCIFFWLAMLITNQQRAKLPLLGLSSILISGGLTQLLKMMIGRPRPYASGDLRYINTSMDMLHGFTTNHDFASFPSGHSTAVFAIAWFAFRNVKSKAGQTAILLLAVLVALSRVALWKHFLSDTVAGAAIGIFMSELVIEISSEQIINTADNRATQ